jgi:uncharacterized protein YyaL (SSP411 family)
VRPKDIQDNATPSGNALACEALLRMAGFTEDGAYRDLAEGALPLAAGPALRYPTALSRWLSAADFSLAGPRQIAIVYDASREGPEGLLEPVRGAFRPHTIAAASPYPPGPDAPPLLAERHPVEGRPTAYVCEHFVCKQPVTDPDELRKQL